MMEWSGGGQWKGRRKRNGMMPTSKKTEQMQIRIFTVPLFGGEEAVEDMNKFQFGRICNHKRSKDL